MDELQLIEYKIWRIRDELAEVYLKKPFDGSYQQGAKYAPALELLADAAEAVDKLRREEKCTLITKDMRRNNELYPRD